MYTNNSSQVVGPIKALFNMLTKFLDFIGTSSRSEFWWGVVWAIIINAFLQLVLMPMIPGILYIIILVYLGLVSLSLSIRRLHDAGHSGLCILLGFIPLVGEIILLVFYIQPTSMDSNY